MSTEVLKFIEMCQWDSVRFFIISGNVFGHLIYYSHLFPLIVSLALAVFIFYKDRKLLAAKWLLATTTILSFWLLADLVLWATDKPSYTMFFWSITILTEPMIYIGMLLFFYALIGGGDISFKKKLVIFLVLLPIILLLPTRLALEGYDLSNCNREAIQGPLIYYGFFIEGLFILWILGFGIKKFFQTKISEEKTKIALVTFGIIFFLFSFAMGNVIGSLLVDWTIGQYGLFGIPVFVALLAYMIIRYKAFNIKLIGAQVLVAALWIALLAVLFVRTIENVRIIVSLTLILFLVVGILLIRSVLREVKQKEEIAKMAEDVKEAYAIEKKAKEDTQELDKNKTEFMLVTQHHLRTPLSVNAGFLDLLIQGKFGKIPKKINNIILELQKSTQKEIKVVNELLDISSYQLGKDVTQLVSGIDMENLLEETLEDPKIQAEKKGIYLKFKKEGSIPKIPADRTKLKLALTNIIDNSVKYTKQGGVNITLKSENNKVMILIKDTGIGIAKELIPNLFNQTFHRSEEARKLFTVGKGIGLFLSSKIIKGHHGKIWAESEGEGKGATFHIELQVV